MNTLQQDFQGWLESPDHDASALLDRIDQDHPKCGDIAQAIKAAYRAGYGQAVADAARQMDQVIGSISVRS